MANVPETLLRHRLFIALLIIFVLSAAGCISHQPEILKVNPVIDYNPLEGFYGESEGMFTVLKGSIPEVKESLKDLVIKKAPQQSTFSIDDELNFVVFRGVFGSGGYGIDIDRVESQGNAFTIYATYIDPGEGIAVGAMVTQPVAIIPIGRLTAGDYEARLRVKKVKADADGTKIIRKVIESEKELSAFNFKVKAPEETIYHYYYTETGGFNQTQASIIWNKISGSDEAKFVTSEKSYSAVIFMHPYTVGAFDPSTAEWVVVISSIPEKAEETRIAIFRLDYQTFVLKESYKFSYPSNKELTLEESIAIIEEEMKKDPYGNPYGNRPVEKEKLRLHGGNYIYSYPATDFGGTVIVNKYVGRAIFYATTIWDGKGKLIVPEAGDSGARPSPPAMPSSSGYISGQAFDEVAGILTKKWDAENFKGFWRDAETGVSTETLVINQTILNSSYTVIEKDNLIYTIKPVPLKYQVYEQANQTPPNTNGFYSATGWLGGKYVLLPENKLARVIFEQSAADVKTVHTRESWSLGDGYKITANSIDVPLRGEEQVWIAFSKDNNILEDKVLPNNSLYSYPEILDGAPVLVTYTSNIYRLPHEDVADFKYTWLRSLNVTEIKEGDVFGIMEVTSVKNNIIEFRNKEPINLIPGIATRLMENMGIQVGSSETDLLFYPTIRR